MLETLIRTARALRGESHYGDNPEYERALVELTMHAAWSTDVGLRLLFPDLGADDLRDHVAAAIREV